MEDSPSGEANSYSDIQEISRNGKVLPVLAVYHVVKTHYYLSTTP